MMRRHCASTSNSKEQVALRKVLTGTDRLKWALEELGIITCGQLQAAQPEQLKQWFNNLKHLPGKVRCWPRRRLGQHIQQSRC